jgi:DNA modification methylase
MLFRKFDKVSGKVLKTTRPLIVTTQEAYVPPAQGKDWWATTTTIWNIDEIMSRRIRDWRRLMGETGHSGARNQTFRKDHKSIYTGTHSVFPAPLMEMIIVRYAGKVGNTILDAFAGGPPRGLVSAIMGYKYTGIEIRREQIRENETTLSSLKIKGASYVLGDGRHLDGVGQYDVAITCPPYFNLEQYSDNKDDLSNHSSYNEFNASMWLCANAHYNHLKPGAFVCIIVGLFRDKKTGELIDFPAHTVENFREAGFIYWQHIILSKNFASAAVRASNAWLGHKLVPRHENLLIFRKPDEKDTISTSNNSGT